ncbi:enduracididine biosynthesis enzyme MppR [Streptomyces sp. NBC_00237]|uniref:enduracididine biosynthesis enzyme MppR n=1 Tax=Streptomyces sp. NBC_00237 TaxID=2975687 RepID=UPI0022513514|nr:enduracididine biosynthesis enzyme MppR [Streptomyces sp. NBC_00237]MCX5206941.1 enduracididine biosynthesis enzyme MppR [Streptomyces sp. NBC_00237]
MLPLTQNTPTGPHGYSLPLSPSGTSSMLTPPPWHFSGDVVMVDYRVDPDAAARFLPPGLSLGADPGAAAAIFATWQWCSDSGEELTDPSRSQFSEFLILLGCDYDGNAMARAPYAWVDQPVPMVRGWVQGMPKQFGAVHQTISGLPGRAGSAKAPGGLFAGNLSVHGRRVVEASVTLTERVQQPPHLHDVPLVHSLVTPEWAAPATGPAPLTASEVGDVEFGEIWTGEARLDFFDALDADFASLAPVEIGAGHVFSYAETLKGGRILPVPGSHQGA